MPGNFAAAHNDRAAEVRKTFATESSPNPYDLQWDAWKCVSPDDIPRRLFLGRLIRFCISHRILKIVRRFQHAS